MRDLTPSEQAIVGLAAGRSAQDVALEIGLPKSDVASIGRAHKGWPSDLRSIKTAASAVLAARFEPEPEPEPVPEPEVPAAPAAVVTGPDIPEEAPMVEPQPDAHADLERTALHDTLAVLDLVEQPPTTRATLRMPLGELVGADGVRIVLGYAVVEVELIPHGVLSTLAGDNVGAGPVATYVAGEFTADGAAAIRALYAQLPAEVA